MFGQKHIKEEILNYEFLVKVHYILIYQIHVWVWVTAATGKAKIPPQTLLSSTSGSSLGIPAGWDK